MNEPRTHEPTRGQPAAPVPNRALQHPLRRDLWLDARRAAWFPAEQVLAIADLHLGYLWAKRAAGQLLPVSVPDDTVPRLQSLLQQYCPREVVLLGDIVHRAIDLPAIGQELRTLAEALRTVPRVRWVGGNHDRGLDALLQRLSLGGVIERQVRVGPHLLLHGDDAGTKGPSGQPDAEGLIVSGHEHPAIWVGDGVTGGAKCPCFLVSRDVVILPAFSNWAAGVSVAKGEWMSKLAREQTFTRAIAIVGPGLIPVSLVKSARQTRGAQP